MHKSSNVLQELSSADKTVEIVITTADSFSLSRLPAPETTIFSDEQEWLQEWPKIGVKDHQGLRRFADFLTSTETAMQTIKDLTILNDYMENQKVLAKLSDRFISRWNREATREMKEQKRYPDFKTFTAFIKAEADLAPILSLLVT